jgi:hypothetical protein
MAESRGPIDCCRSGLTVRYEQFKFRSQLPPIISCITTVLAMIFSKRQDAGSRFLEATPSRLLHLTGFRETLRFKTNGDLGLLGYDFNQRTRGRRQFNIFLLYMYSIILQQLRSRVFVMHYSSIILYKESTHKQQRRIKGTQRNLSPRSIEACINRCTTPMH